MRTRLLLLALLFVVATIANGQWPMADPFDTPVQCIETQDVCWWAGAQHPGCMYCQQWSVNSCTGTKTKIGDQRLICDPFF